MPKVSLGSSCTSRAISGNSIRRRIRSPSRSQCATAWSRFFTAKHSRAMWRGPRAAISAACTEPAPVISFSSIPIEEIETRDCHASIS